MMRCILYVILLMSSTHTHNNAYRIENRHVRSNSYSFFSKSHFKKFKKKEKDPLDKQGMALEEDVDAQLALVSNRLTHSTYTQGV